MLEIHSDIEVHPSADSVQPADELTQRPVFDLVAPGVEGIDLGR